MPLFLLSSLSTYALVCEAADDGGGEHQATPLGRPGHGGGRWSHLRAYGKPPDVLLCPSITALQRADPPDDDDTHTHTPGYRHILTLRLL